MNLLKKFFGQGDKPLSETIEDKKLSEAVKKLEDAFVSEAQKNADLESEIAALKVVNQSEKEAKPSQELLADKDREFKLEDGKKRRVKNVPAVFVGGSKVPIKDFMKDEKLLEIYGINPKIADQIK